MIKIIRIISELSSFCRIINFVIGLSQGNFFYTSLHGLGNYIIMKKNVGITDRIVRFVAVDLLLGISLMGMDVPAFLANAAFVLSIGLVITIIFGYSPLYHLLGLSTIKD